MVDDESSKEVHGQPAPAAPEQPHGFGELRAYVPADLLDVSFPLSVRGYDRRAVDAYIERVNRVIAELKVRASPPAAVRHALDQAGETVQGLLGAAREAADEITASARREADESLARAKAEAAELVVNTSAETDRLSAEAERTVAKARTEAEERVAKARDDAQQVLAQARAEAQERLQLAEDELTALREQAELRMRQLQADTERVWNERRELLASIRATANGLHDLSDAAAARFPGEESAEPEEPLTREPGATTVSPRVAPDHSHDETAEQTASGPDS